MANDSQSSRKNKDYENIKSKGRLLNGSSSTTMRSEELDTPGLRRPARESSFRRQLPPSPASARKSERLEKQTPATLPEKRKPMIVEKHMSNALRRSERGKKLSPSNSSESKKSEKSSASSDANEPKEKKEKTMKQLTLETGEIKESEKQNTKPVRMTKSKIIHSRAYTAFLGRNASNLVKATGMSTQSPKLIHAKKVLEVEDGDALQILKRGDSSHVDCTVKKKMGSPELVESALIGRTGNAKNNLAASHAVSSLKRKREMDVESERKRTKTETCGTCLKRQRPDSVSTKQELCSCKKILYHSDATIAEREDIKGSQLIKLEVANEGAARKHKHMVSSSTDLPALNPGRDEGIVAAGSKEAFLEPSAGSSRNQVNDVQKCLLTTSHIEYEGGRKVLDEQNSLYLLWKLDLSRLCETLQLSEDIKDMVEKVFEYVMNNHCISREPPQAFQISLCRIAASLLKKNIDQKQSLALAKQHLNFCCSEEEATYAYLKLRCLKHMFLYHTGNLKIPNSPRASSVSTKDDPFGSPNASNHQQEGIVDQSLSIKKLVERDISISLERLEKKCKKQLEKLKNKEREELRELYRVCEEEKAELETKHRTESAVIRCLDRSSTRKHRLQMLENAFARKVEQQNQQMSTRIEDLRKMQRSAQKLVKQKFTLLSDEVRSWSQVELLDRLSSDESRCSLEYPQTSEQARVLDGNENDSLEKQSPYRNARDLPLDMVKSIEIPDDSSVVGSGVQIEAVIEPLYGDTEKVHSVTPLSPEERTPDASRLSISDGEVIHGVLETGDILEGVHISKEINGAVDLASIRPTATRIDQQNGEDSTIHLDSHLQELCPGNAPVVQSECTLPQGGILHLSQGLQDLCSLPSISTEMQDGDEPSTKERHDTEQVEALQSHPNEDVPSDCNFEAPIKEPRMQSQLSPTDTAQKPLELYPAGEIRQPPSTLEHNGGGTDVVQSDGSHEASVTEILHVQRIQGQCSPPSISPEMQDGDEPSTRERRDTEQDEAPQDHCSLPSVSSEMQGGNAPSSGDSHDTEEVEALQSLPNAAPYNCSFESLASEPTVQPQLPAADSAGKIGHLPSTLEQYGTHNDVQSDGNCEASVMELSHAQIEYQPRNEVQNVIAEVEPPPQSQPIDSPPSELRVHEAPVRDHVVQLHILAPTGCSSGHNPPDLPSFKEMEYQTRTDPNVPSGVQTNCPPSNEGQDVTDEVEPPPLSQAIDAPPSELRILEAPVRDPVVHLQISAPMDCSSDRNSPRTDHDLPSSVRIEYLPCNEGQNVTAEVEPPPQSQPIDVLRSELRIDEAPVRDHVVQLHILAPMGCSSGHNTPDLPSSKEMEYQTRTDHNVPSGVQIECQPSNEGQNVTTEVEPPPHSQPIDAPPSELGIHEAPVRDPVVHLHISVPMDCSSDHNPPRTDRDLPSGVQIECQPSYEGQNVTAEVEPPPHSQPIDAPPSELRIHEAPVRDPMVHLQISAPMDCSSDHNPPRMDHELPSGVQIEYQPGNEGQNVTTEVELPLESQPIDALLSEPRIHDAPVRDPVVQLQISAPMDHSSDHNPLLTSRSLGDNPQRNQMQTAHVVSRMALPFSLDPLQNELDRVHKDIAHSVKIYEDKKLQLKTDCVKEVEEAVAQIHRKYEIKLQETEVFFSREKKVMEARQNKVLMNKILAEALRFKSVEVRAFDVPGMQQETVTSFRRQQVQLQQTGQRLPSVSGSPVTPTQPPHVRPHSSTLPPPQPVHHSRPLASIPTISHFTGAHPAISRQGGSEIRAPAPHLQRIRPRPPLPCGMPSQQPPHTTFSSSSPLSSTSLPPLSRRMPSQHAPNTTGSPSTSLSSTNVPPLLPRRMPSQHAPNTTGSPSTPLSSTNVPPLLPRRSSPSLSSTSLSPLPSRMPGQHAPHGATSPNIFSSLPSWGLYVDQVQVALSGLGLHGINVGNRGADDIVCLSDDD